VYEISYGEKPAYNYTGFNYRAVLSHQFNQYLNLGKCPFPTANKEWAKSGKTIGGLEAGPTPRRISPMTNYRNIPQPLAAAAVQVKS
jgi:hypothetical protein